MELNKIRGRAIEVDTQIDWAKRCSAHFDMAPEYFLSRLSLAGFQIIPDSNEIALDAAAIAAHLKAQQGKFRVVGNDDNSSAS